MKLRRTISWVLLICMVISIGGLNIHASSISESPISTTNAKLELMAQAYVRNFVDKCYLYEDNDLTANTIHTVVSEKAASAGFSDTKQFAQSMSDLSLRNETISVDTLCKDIQLVDDYAEYLSYTRSVQGITLHDFTYYCDLLETKVDTDWATVHLYTTVMFYYEPGGEQAVGCDHYYVDFAKIDGEWLIARVQPEEMVAYGITTETFDLQSSLASFNRILPQLQSAGNTAIAPDEETRTSPQIHVRDYNRNNAVAYAFTYTTSTYTATEGNNDSFFNENFLDYGANCQNFVSQCVWAGFGGNDSLNNIRSLELPMDTTGNTGETTWHCCVTDPITGITTGPTSSWIATGPFFRFFKNSANETTGARIYGEWFDGISGANYSGTVDYASQLVGSVLHVLPEIDSEGDILYNHSIIITAATGTSASQIRYCGNSPMRKSYLLSSATYYVNNTVRLMVPYSLKKTTPCGDAGCIYPASSTGTSFICSQCGNSRICVEGTMLCPVPVNSTHTIQATANMSCYRIAIGITPPSGYASWTTYSNTSSASRSYTFSETGLYTIQITVRDMSEDEANSHTQVHIFKVRIYEP